MGWSDAEFWHSTPRKYNAVFWQHIKMNKPPEQQVKTGSDAIKDIIGTMGKLQG